jgi:hypothetical protein
MTREEYQMKVPLMKKHGIEVMQEATGQDPDIGRGLSKYLTLIAGVASTSLRGHLVLGPVCDGRIPNSIHE